MPRHEITPEQEATEREKAAPRHPGASRRLRRRGRGRLAGHRWARRSHGRPPARGPAERQHRVPAQVGRVDRRSRARPRSSDPRPPWPIRRHRAARRADRRRPGRVTAFIARVPIADLRGGRQDARACLRGLGAGVPSADGKALLVSVQFDADKADDAWSTPRPSRCDCARRAKQHLDAGAAGVTSPGPVASSPTSTAFGGIDGILLRRHRRRLRHPADRLPQPDPALRGPADRRSSGSPLAALVIYPLAKNGRTRAQRAEPGHPVRSSSSAPRPTTRCCSSARYREELHDHESKYDGDAGRLARGGRADRGQRGDRHPRPALPAAVPARQHQGPRPGRRDRHRRRAASPR